MILAIFAILASIFLWSIYRKLTLWSRCGVPTNYRYFIESFKMASGVLDVNTIKETGKVVGVYAGLEPVLLVGDVDLAKKVLSTQFEDFVNHTYFQHENAPMGQSVLTLQDDRWRETRKIITPTFTSSKLRSMQTLIDESCLDLIEQLDLNKGKPVDVKDLICGFTMDVIASTAFGTKVNTAKNPQNEIAVNGRRFLSNDLSLTNIAMMMTPWISFKILKLSFFTDTAQYFSDVTLSILKKRRQDPSSRRQDLIQYLMEAEYDGQRLTDKEIADNGVLFFLAGHDTSSIALIHCLHFLALNPDVQSKLQAEIDELHLDGQKINYDTVMQLKYLDCVLKETLRLRAPVTRANRVASHDTELGPYKVPKGTQVWIANHAIHTNPENFEQGEQFIPERFLKDSNLSHNPQAFLTFAPGPRNCIGERFAIFEMKLCLIRILRLFTFESCPETKSDLDYYFGVFLFQPKSAFLKPVRRQVG